VRTQGETIAFQIANAGVDAATRAGLPDGVQSGNFPADRHDLRRHVRGLGGTRLDNSEYELRSVGTDVTGFSETIVVRFFYINLWEMIFAAGNQESLTAGGGGINGNTNVTGPFYVRGSVEMSGASYVHKGPFFVDGALTRQGNANWVRPMCRFSSMCPVRTRSRARRRSTLGLPVGPRIELPRFTDDELREAAQRPRCSRSTTGSGCERAWWRGTTSRRTPSTRLRMTIAPSTRPTAGPSRAATHGSDDSDLHRFGYKYIGAGSNPSPAGQGTNGLTIGPTSFGAWYGNGYTLPNMSDDFAYDAVNKILYVEGTVFIDGPLEIDRDITYRGNGTLVVNGDVTIQGNLYPANTGATEAERRRMGPRHALGIATPANVTVNGDTNNVPTPSPGDPPKHAFALYAAGSVRWTTNNYFIGSIVAGHIHTGNNNVHMVTDPDLPDFLPDSLPGRDAPILTKGAWARQ
jgi:hypothetical protein